MEQHPRKYHKGQLRTLQRRVADWKKGQIEKQKVQRITIEGTSKIAEVNAYISLALAT